MLKAQIEGLRVFPSVEGLPRSDAEIQKVLQLFAVKNVKCFALGPEGTNIGQACQRWIERMDIFHKTSVEFCDTPEISLEKAHAFTKPSEQKVGVFWTCAVFYALNRLFFENPDVYPFFAQEVMLLDEMQLAVRKEEFQRFSGQPVEFGEWLERARVASHPSPAPLVQNISGLTVVKANSNAEAARMCADGQVELCITTEKSREIYGLMKLHSFGSPEMVFFAGITAEGAEIIKKAYQYEVARSAADLI